MATTTAAPYDPVPRPAPSSRSLFHLDGFRSFASLIVLIEHYCAGPHGDLAYLFSRANVMVCYYVVLSGFVTAYAYGGRDFPCSWRYDGTRASYYVKRFGRVALSYYAGFWVDYAIFSLSRSTPRLVPLDATSWLQLLMSNELERPWRASGGGYNAAGWTVAVLAHYWLAWPFMQPLLKRASTPALVTVGLVAAAAGVLLSIGVYTLCADGAYADLHSACSVAARHVTRTLRRV
jgi:peptidoglycan/LPS O-acetylase OafA/YrhL